MLAKLNSRLFATAATVAALTVGISVAQPAQKASAQTAAGSTAAAELYRGFGVVDYQAIGSGAGVNEFRSGNVQIGATDIPVEPQAGETVRPVANLRIEAPVNGGDTGLSQDQFCAIIRGEVTTFSNGTPITVVFRSDNSGTKFIVNSVCGADGSSVPGAIGVGSTGAVLDTVASTPGAIGYAEQANIAALPSALGSPIIGPTYALFRSDDAEASAFIDSIIEAPDLVSALGYNPL
ncbi:PstS family phosphate ABC transporter substrate-binding protein [Iningainema tapete]|uniref:Substrate-binding domain-containing protein n=1 Tax=Iningainema tapete BLCC-T55 TaxID=2748662 RepID=A0A8J7CF86_9CYAN|nr:substrate-binding domain-containing protein [Iningainema tapete]MBD2774480.1 substrate-binding domain-containing protein [Iningainema tapete BLCC-T55]